MKFNLTIFLLIIWISCSGQPPGNCRLGKSATYLEGENVKVRVMNQGDFFWSPEESLPKFFWPKNTNKNRQEMDNQLIENHKNIKDIN
jgi:hypothetical protein